MKKRKTQTRGAADSGRGKSSGGRGQPPRARDGPGGTRRATHSHEKESKTDRSRDAAHLSFPIVGIGASAGGIEAFTALLKRLPADTGMAYVFVQHLHPGYQSALTDILARETRMRVVEAEDGTAVEPNHVYVIPPGVHLGIMGGRLQLLPRPGGQERRLPIDQFFRLLAEDRGSRAIGIILSGTASDGVLGLKALKAEGGITFAQSEDSAKYDGMPHNAIASGAVDVVLAPEDIADELERLARHPYVAQERTLESHELAPPADEQLDKIFMLLRRHTGHDFTHYKRTTTLRRIRRRMLLHKLESVSDYVRYLQERPDELADLFQDMLITVTAFFRDPEVYDSLVEKAFPAIAQNRSTDDPIRIWVTGCSSGEEAYSIVIALLEFLGERAASTPVQVFATDIDASAIDRARAGIYPENIAQDVSPERLRRFFTRVEGGYQVSKTVRDRCVFAVQDLIKDPPFSRLDLICCRNLLIYLDSMLQERVMRIFHYALVPEGMLLLGTAENIGEHSDFFQPVDGRHKLYGKRAQSTPVHIEFGDYMETPPVPANEGNQAFGRARQDVGHASDLQREADRLLLSRYAPPGVVIDSDMNIVQFRGRTGRYLEPAAGEASLGLLKMARDDLRAALDAAVREAMESGAPVSRKDTRLKIDGGEHRVDIEILPLSMEGGFYLVVFRKIVAPAADHGRAKRGKAATRDEKDREIKRLEEELSSTKEYLQSVIEQQETNNEELRSANEEIQSTNEELQSMNEELETAKEELQSMNEELVTVNDELESRNEELARANDDLINMIASVDIATLIVGPDLRIRRFTPRSEKLLNLIDTDVGRPISDIKPNIQVPDFSELLASAMAELQTREQDVQDTNGRWFTMRVRTYTTTDKTVDGVVVSFIDVDELRRAFESARAAQDYAEAVVATLRHPMLVLDKDMRVVTASRAYLDAFRVSENETRGHPVDRLGSGQWGLPALRQRIGKVLTDGEEFTDFEVSSKFERLGERTFTVSGRPLRADLPGGPMMVMQIEDVTRHEGNRSTV